MTDQETQLYIIALGENDDNDNNEWLYAARSPSEAFALWREQAGGERKTYTMRVWPVPPCPSEPGEVSWPHTQLCEFDQDYEDLTTRAVRASYEPTTVEEAEGAT